MNSKQQVAVARGAVARLTPEFAALGVAVEFKGELCSYPACKCIVQTSTTQPEPICPRGLPATPSANGSKTTPPDDGLDIPPGLKLTAEQRREHWAKNPPKAAAAPRKEITMPKTKAKAAKPSGGDKNTTLLKMLAGKGSTVEQLTKALDWLPHTLRARISRLNKPKSKGGEGLKIERDREGGVTSYRIA